MKVEEWEIEKLIPYIRNPRINNEAVAKVAASIKEFGFRQPIVVDDQSVIIAGHTRLVAAQRLGLKKVPVHAATGLTPQQVKAYRIADNRVAQESSWDDELLRLELQEIELPELTGFEGFEIEEILKEISFEEGTEGEQGTLDELEPKMIRCPHCRKDFDLRDHN